MDERFYLEVDPNIRLDMIEEAILNGHEVELNKIRKELLCHRYDFNGVRKDGTVPDKLLKLWMCLEFNKNPKGIFGGRKGAIKEIKKCLEEISFDNYIKKGDLYKELLGKEFYHLVCLYIELCKDDRTYNSLCFGLVPMKKKGTENKICKDLKETGIDLPKLLNMEEDLELIIDATTKALNKYID